MPSFLAGIVGAAAAALTWSATIDRAGSWSIVESSDVLTDVLNVEAYVHSGRDGRGIDSLRISCRRGGSGFWFKYVHPSLPASGRAPLRYRLDDDTPVTTQWLYATDGVHRADPDTFKAFIGRLATAKRFRIQAMSVRADFDVAGADEMLTELRRRRLIPTD